MRKHQYRRMVVLLNVLSFTAFILSFQYYVTQSSHAANTSTKFAVTKEEVNDEVIIEEIRKTEVTNVEKDTAILADVRSPRIIDAYTVEDVVPSTGKFLAADLKEMRMFLYEDKVLLESFPLLSVGKKGEHWETPSGLYSVHTKERNHFSSIGKVYMPYSMQFFGNYFIHGETYYADGTPTASTFSGGCIRLETQYAEQVFAFAEVGTPVFVYDPPEKKELEALYVSNEAPLELTASAYLVADLDTAEVYTEKNATQQYPVWSLTKLMTAIVANETISYNRTLSLDVSELTNDTNDVGKHQMFHVGELMYPLLMSSSNAVASRIASYYGKSLFVSWMNKAANSFHMDATSFSDTTGVSEDNSSTLEDIYRLVWYIREKKSFVLKVTQEKETTISSVYGIQYAVKNINTPVYSEPYQGGIAGLHDTGNDSLFSVLELTIGDEIRTFALGVLGSRDRETDMQLLTTWVTEAVDELSIENKACVSCVQQKLRKIELP